MLCVIWVLTNVMTGIYHYNVIQDSFTALSILCTLSIHPTLPPALASTDVFVVSIVWPFPECHVVGSIQYTVISDWLLPFRNVHLRFLHVFS